MVEFPLPGGDNQPHELTGPLIVKAGELVQALEVKKYLKCQEGALQRMGDIGGNPVFPH